MPYHVQLKKANCKFLNICYKKVQISKKNTGMIKLFYSFAMIHNTIVE